MSEKMKRKKVEFKIDHTEPVFFTDSITVTHNNSKFIIDFRQSTPRLDQIGNEQKETIVVKHQPVMMDPWLVKSFIEILTKNMESFEKKFGKVQKVREKGEEKISYIG
ncbi:MAG: hypothetical protein DRP11_02430 [Candidatus Aenigmatarchaeota archaeon]|nr:MAG: hypothetical protein DRP11_02430 [Candidatus Aenigmarchaeota archaeon]